MQLIDFGNKTLTVWCCIQMYPVLRTPVTGNHTPNHVDTGYRWLIHVLTLLVLSSCTCLILGYLSSFAIISVWAKLVFHLEICNLSLLLYKKVVVDLIVKVCSGHVLIVVDVCLCCFCKVPLLLISSSGCAGRDYLTVKLLCT